jgi:hypothetical protein
MIETRLLQQADVVLSKCGRPIAPSGMSAVCFYRGIPVQAVFPVAPTALSQTITKEISGDTTFLLRAISTTSGLGTALRIQIQMPSGRFLISNLADVLTLAGYGSWRFHFSEELECPPGTKITVTLLDTNAAAAQPIMLLFEGADRYLLKGGHGGRPQLASDLPRYRLSAPQNILAPCSMAGLGPETPAGFTDEEFIYCSDHDTEGLGYAIDVNAASLSGTLSIPMDQGSDFLCRRLSFVQTADAGVTLPGLWLGRMRDSSGYALMDDYLDLIGILNGAPMPGKDWFIRRGGEVFVDVRLVGATGQGNVYLTVYMEGVRRS